MAETTTRTWDDLPPQSWAEHTEPPTDALADWLRSLDRDQLLWVLGRQRATWQRESRCFMENHDGRIERADTVMHPALGGRPGALPAADVLAARLGPPLAPLEHVRDRHGYVWRVVRDGGMVTRADYGGVITFGIAAAEREVGPLVPLPVPAGSLPSTTPEDPQ